MFRHIFSLTSMLSSDMIFVKTQVFAKFCIRISHDSRYSFALAPGEPRCSQHGGARQQGNRAWGDYRDAWRQPAGCRSRDPLATAEGGGWSVQVGAAICLYLPKWDRAFLEKATSWHSPAESPNPTISATQRRRSTTASQRNIATPFGWSRPHVYVIDTVLDTEVLHRQSSRTKVLRIRSGKHAGLQQL